MTTYQSDWDPNSPFQMTGGDYRFSVDVPDGVKKFDIVITAGVGTIYLEAEAEVYTMPKMKGEG